MTDIPHLKCQDTKCGADFPFFVFRPTEANIMNHRCPWCEGKDLEFQHSSNRVTISLSGKTHEWLHQAGIEHTELGHSGDKWYVEMDGLVNIFELGYEQSIRYIFTGEDTKTLRKKYIKKMNEQKQRQDMEAMN